MSLTPVDEPGRRGSSATDGDGDSRTLAGRIVGRARRALRSIRHAVAPTAGSESEDGPRSRPDPSGHAHRHPLRKLDPDHDRSGDRPACPPVDDLPARDRPLAYPARDGSMDNDADLVVTRDAETLTLELPGEPEAHISSDTWERLEP